MMSVPKIVFNRHKIKKKYAEALAEEFPDLHCPLSLELYIDPVQTLECRTYERAFIQNWFDKGHKTDPVHNTVLENTKLMPNLAVKGIVIKLLQDRPYLLEGNPDKEEAVVVKPAEDNNKNVSASDRPVPAKPAAVETLAPVKNELIEDFADYQMVDFMRDQEKARAALARLKHVSVLTLVSCFYY